MSFLEQKLRSALKPLGAEQEAGWILDFVNKKTKDPALANQLLDSIIQRRLEGEPLAYIFEEWPFLSLSLKVGRGVLIPRPETEELAEIVANLFCEANKTQKNQKIKILDLGAGSGALGLGVASEILNKDSLASVDLHLVERSLDAQQILSDNLSSVLKIYQNRLSGKIHLKSWNDLDQALTSFDIILGNPPYVSSVEWREDVDNSVKSFEPTSAFLWNEFTDAQGDMAASVGLTKKELEDHVLGPYFENLYLADKRLVKGGLLGIEMGPAQAQIFKEDLLQKISKQFNLSLRVVSDLSSKIRFLMGQKDG